MAIVRTKEEYHAKTTEQMGKHLLRPDWNIRQKMALACRMLWADGHLLDAQLRARL